MNDAILKLAKSKALQSRCRYKVAAIGFNRKGDVVTTAVNKPLFASHHGGQHAEMEVLRKKKGVTSIVICRVNKSGDLLPIDPCSKCFGVCNKLGIKIYSLRSTYGY
jgi:tRNA(Arg) A34 adenosine deaminase TadA